MHRNNRINNFLVHSFGIFGAGKLKNIGGDLGSAIKSFKEGISDKGELKKTKNKKNKLNKNHA